MRAWRIDHVEYLMVIRYLELANAFWDEIAWTTLSLRDEIGHPQGSARVGQLNPVCIKESSNQAIYSVNALNIAWLVVSTI
ncbi:protein of unknown function [Paraburkholderia kururiensis]